MGRVDDVVVERGWQAHFEAHELAEVVLGLRICLCRASRHGLRRRTEIINQDIDADQEHPQRENHYSPLNIAPAKQQKQR